MITRRGLIRAAGIAAPAIILRPSMAQFDSCLPGVCGFAAVAPSVYATFDGVVTNGTVDATKLIYTHPNTLVGMARTTAQKNSGKWYFEITASSNVSAQNDCISVIIPTATDSRVVNSGLDGGIVFAGLNAKIFSNDADSGRTLGANITTGDIIGVATDLDNDKIWFRKAPAGNWNGQAIGSQNPVGAVGGASISSYSGTTMAPAVGFTTTAGSVWSANFGQFAFTGAVPTGFTAGWTV